MFGAGFSRNAQGRSSDIRAFPSWVQLGEDMYDVLYPASNAGAAAREDEKRRAELPLTSSDALYRDYWSPRTRSC